ncbi:MAG TPA: Ku protein [Trueperaceae bacterium]|nr:Ku protein [Trueperaceae bacterium]
MSVRAMWKGVVEFGTVSVPVKLYSAVKDKTVSFRLLNREDGKPVRQVLVNSKSKKIVEYEDSERGFVTGKGELVSLDSDELESLEPDASRTIEVTSFLPPSSIEYRWYLRPYYLGPDGDDEAYFTLVAALGRDEFEGVAQWVMRDKEYVGALRLHRGYPMLVTLRYAEELVPLEGFSPAQDDELDPKQVKMASQLIEMLSADFEPEKYEDEYRESVLDLIKRKRSGETVKKSKPRAKKATGDLTSALEKSLSGSKRSGGSKAKSKSKGSGAGGGSGA